MSRQTCVLGISALFHDSAAALIADGRIVAAAQEERFTRVKADSSIPHHAIDFCLAEAGVGMDEVERVVFYEDPFLKFDRLLNVAHAVAPRGLPSFLRSMPSWLTRKLWLETTLARELGTRAISVCEHHVSHAASAFFPSPFESAAILTIDGVGEWATTTWGVGRGSRIELKAETRFPDSLGLLYSAFTGYCGFKINSGEYKLMGLAPYGRPVYLELIRTRLASIGDDGSLVLNQDYFNYLGGLTTWNARFESLFGGPPRRPESEITQRDMDLAASIQAFTNDCVMAMATHVHEQTGERQLVMAGGVALNVVATGQLLRDGPYDDIWVQPAAGDAGGALGAALWYWHHELEQAREHDPEDSMSGCFLGPEIADDDPQDDELLRERGASWTLLEEAELADRIAELIEQGQVVGLARGRMEWGPRALGARSILADARSPEMQLRLNLKIKFRESFRPFAPMVLADRAKDWFEMDGDCPYMTLACPVQAGRLRELPETEKLNQGFSRLASLRSEIPAVTHVDNSARVQTVDAGRNPFVASVLTRFEERTGCPVVVNTSFNVRGEPIVRTAEDAHRCFAITDMDAVVIGRRLLLRREQSRLPSAEERARWLEGLGHD